MRKLTSVIALVALLAVPAGAALAADAWQVDGNHSQVNFKVRHFFTPVTGSFSEFDVQLSYDPEDPAASSVEVTIPVASVDTGVERRDNHLRTADFFDAETHPSITFRSSRIEVVSDTELIAHGDLTIKDVTREVALPITVLGVMDLPERMQRDGVTRVGSFQANLTLDRRDFGVGTGSWAETAVVGGDVEIEILVEARG